MALLFSSKNPLCCIKPRLFAKDLVQIPQQCGLLLLCLGKWLFKYASVVVVYSHLSQLSFRSLELVRLSLCRLLLNENVFLQYLHFVHVLEQTTHV